MTYAENVTTTPIAAKTLREFGLLMAGMVAGIFGVLLPLLKKRTVPLTPWAIALVFAVLALARPTMLSLVYRGWMRFGAILGAINSRIILTAMFWIVITPIALIAKAVGRDILHLRTNEPDAKTYRVPIGTPTDPKRGMERPF
jgi:hypothetical protein